MRSSLPVLYVDNTFTFGGAINALAHLLSALDTESYRPIVLSAQSRAFLQEILPSVETHHWDVKLPWVHDQMNQRVVQMRGLRDGPARKVWNKLRALYWLTAKDGMEAIRVGAFARQKDVGIVHLNNGVEGMVPPLFAGRMLRLPVIAHARGPHTTTGIVRQYVRMPSHWIAVSESVAQNLLEARVPRERITVIHDAIDLEAFLPGPPPVGLRDELGLPAGACVFGVFARIIPWKGIREFVLAAAHVIRAMPNAYGLVVGDRSDGSEQYYNEVVMLGETLGIADRLRFVGFRKDVADLMRLCDVVVHTSTIPEPFGMTVIEAMATGTPVVAANSGGPTEIITPGVDGLLVDPENSEALSAAIISLLNDDEARREIGARSASRARTHYSAERYARDVESVYAHVLARRTRTL